MDGGGKYTDKFYFYYDLRKNEDLNAPSYPYENEATLWPGV